MLVVLCADRAAVGKPNRALLPQQSLMEMFLCEVTNKERMCVDQQDPANIAEWQGVTFNAKYEVTEIFFEHEDLEGPVAFEWLPLTVVHLSMASNFLSGSLNTSALSPSLQTFCVRFNQFSGTLDLCGLPEALNEFDCASNELSGTINLEHLPSLSEIYLSDNAFHGSVCLIKLPESLVIIDISYNQFSGAVDLTHLPSMINLLSIGNNSFHGEANFGNIPLTLIHFDISNTEISGVLRIFVTESLKTENSNVEVIDLN